MIQTFRYRTTIAKNEIQHTVYSKSLEDSIKDWLEKIELFKEEVYSFNPDIVREITNQIRENKFNLNKESQMNTLTYLINEIPQTTYIDIIEKGKPDFIASVTLLTTEEGGRKGFALSGYRPHFQIKDKKELTTAEQLFVDKQIVYPGETAISEIRILAQEIFKGSLYPGLQFQLGEGPKIIANGVIIDVINEDLRKANT